MPCPTQGQGRSQGLPLQVHAAQLSKEALRDLGWRWPLGSNVVLKVQHDDMRCLMDSDVRNLGRLAAFVRDSMPFDAVPVRSPALADSSVSDKAALEQNGCNQREICHDTVWR